MILAKVLMLNLDHSQIGALIAFDCKKYICHDQS